MNIGDKVFLRSNEPNDPLVVGHIVAFKELGRIARAPFPIVKDERSGKEWMGGVLRPYCPNTHAGLEILRPIEQWNYLVRDTEAHNQITEKYGVKYKTFK